MASTLFSGTQAEVGGEDARVQPDGGKNDRARDDLCEKGRNMHQDQPVADHGNGHGAKHGAENGSASAHQRCAAKHNRCHDLQLKADSSIGGTRAKA
ncbi:hypothetical protein D3C80_2028420 [compost metagenome]